MKIPVFDTFIDVFEFTRVDDYPGKEFFDSKVEELFNLPQVVNAKTPITERNGNALSTIHLCSGKFRKHILYFLQLTDHVLGVWIIEQLRIAGIDYNLSRTRDVTAYKFHRAWANRMFKGCDGQAHRHKLPGEEKPDLVAIYYHQVPDNSAELIFINEKDMSIGVGKHYLEYPEEQRFHFKPKAGMLVVHDPHIMHAISTHQSDLPRTCIIFEPAYKQI